MARGREQLGKSGRREGDWNGEEDEEDWGAANVGVAARLRESVAMILEAQCLGSGVSIWGIQEELQRIVFAVPKHIRIGCWEFSSGSLVSSAPVSQSSQGKVETLRVQCPKFDANTKRHNPSGFENFQCSTVVIF